MTHKRITSGYELEELNGYCRAVKAGNTVYVAGTTARNKDLELDSVGQARAIFLIISEALEKAGSNLSHVVRTTIYVLNMNDADAIGRVHGEFFKDIKPALTIVQVAGLHSKALLEIEITSVIPDN
jgi:enamine deaminase RidA (YjgF/YER057c/UK114 family)